MAPERADMPSPPGFPAGYSWEKGDWLCPRPGCEGFVTRAKFDRCVNCGRAQPFFRVLMELAKNDRFRTTQCVDVSCGMRDCGHAHAECELRDHAKSREYRRTPESQTPPLVPAPHTGAEMTAFVDRWHLGEPAVSVLHRLPGPLADVVLRTFFCESSDTTVRLLKSLADLIRPRRKDLVRPEQVLETLPAILRRNSVPTGVACSENGMLALTLDKEVAVFNVRDCDEHVAGLLGFALSFNGLTVVHAAADLENLKSNFPKLYVDMCERIRVVDNPSELLYVADGVIDQIIDRASQARLDALNPNPLLPTPPSS